MVRVCGGDVVAGAGRQAVPDLTEQVVAPAVLRPLPGGDIRRLPARQHHGEVVIPVLPDPAAHRAPALAVARHKPAFFPVKIPQLPQDMARLADRHHAVNPAQLRQHAQGLTEHPPRKQPVTLPGGPPDDVRSFAPGRPLQPADKQGQPPPATDEGEGEAGDDRVVVTQYQHQLPFPVKAAGGAGDIQLPALPAGQAAQQGLPGDGQYLPDPLRLRLHGVVMVQHGLRPRPDAAAPVQVGAVRFGRQRGVHDQQAVNVLQVAQRPEVAERRQGVQPAAQQEHQAELPALPFSPPPSGARHQLHHQ